MKMMDKAHVKRLAVRHKNIHNEIMMEKTALLTLRGHPNILTLYKTFSDDRALYFVYELLDGGELWAQLMDGEAQIGCDMQVARYYLLQVLDGLEHVHRGGFVHRYVYRAWEASDSCVCTCL